MPPANNRRNRTVYRTTYRPENDVLRQRINTKTATEAQKEQARIMKGRAPRLTSFRGDVEVVEERPYQLWNMYRERMNGRVMRGENMDQFAGRSVDPQTGRTEHFLTRPHVTYRTTYKKKNRADGCKYGRYSDGDGKVYCLANPNHHKLDNPDRIKSQNAYMRRDIEPGYHQFRAHAAANRSGVVLRLPRRNRLRLRIPRNR